MKIDFEFSKDVDVESLTDSVNWLLAAWRKNGQLVGREFLIAQTEKGLEAYAAAPETDSLAEKFNNIYVNKRLSEISEQGVIPKITVLGPEPESARLCECDKIKSYILFTTYASMEPPLKCFACFGVVPLYKIPKTADDEYHDIISWQNAYQHCDSLQMGCSVGERFALNQLSKYDSRLTKNGLETCRSIEKVTGKKVFYYLYKYYAKSYKNELQRKCPNCSGEWYLKKPLHDKFDFMCKKCKLLSNISWDVR